MKEYERTISEPCFSTWRPSMQIGCCTLFTTIVRLTTFAAQADEKGVVLNGCPKTLKKELFLTKNIFKTR